MKIKQVEMLTQVLKDIRPESYADSQVVVSTLDSGNVVLKKVTLSKDTFLGRINGAIDAIPKEAIISGLATEAFVLEVAGTGDIPIDPPADFAFVDNLSGSYDTEAGTLTNTGMDTLDIPVDSRVLLTGQTNLVENGLYAATRVAQTWILTRTNDVLRRGNTVAILSGDKAGYVFALVRDAALDPIVIIGTDDIKFVVKSTGGRIYTAGEGIDITSNVVSVKIDGTTIIIDEAGNITVNPDMVSGGTPSVQLGLFALSPASMVLAYGIAVKPFIVSINGHLIVEGSDYTWDEATETINATQALNVAYGGTGIDGLGFDAEDKLAVSYFASAAP